MTVQGKTQYIKKYHVNSFIPIKANNKNPEKRHVAIEHIIINYEQNGLDGYRTDIMAFYF
jgi:hypothetical protein